MFRVLITGARDLPEAEVVWVPLWMLLHHRRSIIVTHGANPRGADFYARQWFGLPEQPFNRAPRTYESRVEYLAVEDPHPAPWETLGKSAGGIRNQWMVNTNPDACYAFPTPKSRGTWDCVARAWVRGIPVYIFDHLQVLCWRELDDDEGERLARARLDWGTPKVLHR